MEVPDKIYVSVNVLGEVVDNSWFYHNFHHDDVEYMRTDAFIEKAAEWVKENAANYVSKDNQGEPYLFRIGLVDAFIKAMKQ